MLILRLLLSFIPLVWLGGIGEMLRVARWERVADLLIFHCADGLNFGTLHQDTIRGYRRFILFLSLLWEFDDFFGSTELLRVFRAPIGGTAFITDRVTLDDNIAAANIDAVALQHIIAHFAPNIIFLKFLNHPKYHPLQPEQISWPSFDVREGFLQFAHLLLFLPGHKGLSQFLQFVTAVIVHHKCLLWAFLYIFSVGFDACEYTGCLDPVNDLLWKFPALGW